MPEQEDVVIVLDCGATNIKTIAVGSEGRIVAQASRPNSPQPQKDESIGWLVWDLEEIWLKICEGAREVSKEVRPRSIRAVTVTTWGADGAPIRRNGTLTYPPISWQCPRTKATVKNVLAETPAFRIFQVTGYQPISFNTLFRLIWLREHAPKALSDAYTWLMMPGLIVHKMTGQFHIEPTSASTMMAMDLKKRDWSTAMLELAGLDPSFFPDWREPGEIVGYVTEKVSAQSGIPAGVPVIAGGHDTQFALYGSGAGMDEAVVSSGTWEILGIRSERFIPSKMAFENGLIIEADVQRGLWNPQLLMMGSGVLEWVLDKFFPRMGDEKYAIMTKEAETVPAGSDGVTFIPSFVKESGPTRKYCAMGTILGLSLMTSRGHVTRSALEGLSFQLKQALLVLKEAASIDIKRIRVVGGGAKNILWNQIRADVLDLPVMITEQKEYTTLGAALTAFAGIGRYKSLKEALKAVNLEPRVFEPGGDRSIYEAGFDRYIASLKSLRKYYLHQDASMPKGD